MPNLGLVTTRSTGFDHVDVEACKDKGIFVCSVPHYGENTVAEFAFALMLNISRKLMQSVTRVRSGSFDFTGLRGFDLAGRKIGLLGFGNIGQKFAKMCKGFEMEVISYDVFADQPNMQEKAKEIGVTFMDLNSVLTQADVISLHLPLLPQTKYILNQEAFEKMKKGVIIINTSRGELIDNTALLEAINTRKVIGAGLDVLEGETMIKDEVELLHNRDKEKYNMEVMLESHILINHPHVFVTPHNAFNTQDALERILNTTIQNILNFIHHKCDQNRVDLK